MEWKPIVREQRKYSERYGFAGTLDGLYETEKRGYAILEIKSTDGTEQESWKIQTSAQQELWRAEYPSALRYSLQLKSDGNFKMRGPYTSVDDWLDFQSALRIYRRIQK